jgi:hypothetical protein
MPDPKDRIITVRLTSAALAALEAEAAATSKTAQQIVEALVEAHVQG